MEKTNLQVGKWYVNHGNAMFKFNGKYDEDNSPCGHGFGTDDFGNEFISSEEESDGWGTYGLREATDLELEAINQRIEKENIVELKS